MKDIDTRRPVIVLPGAGETGRASPATAGLRDAPAARPPHRARRGRVVAAVGAPTPLRAAAGRQVLRIRGATMGGAPA